jgi:hypothetical protein
MNAGRLAAASGQCEIYLLEGGIEAWKRAGLPVAPAAGDANRTGGGLIERVASLFR